MALLIQTKAAKEAKGIPQQRDQERLRERLERIAQDPHGNHPDARRLTGTSLYQARYGIWRALYEITSPGDVVVVKVGHRMIGASAMSDKQPVIGLLSQTQDSVTLRRSDYEALLTELEDAEDREAAFEYELAKVKGGVPDLLTMAEAERLRAGEHPVRIWREKRGLTQQTLAAAARISKSFLSEIEGGTNTPSVETLRKLAHELKVDLDTLAGI